MGVYERVAPASVTGLMDALNEHPHQVSTQLLSPIAFSTILDAGCGTNVSLATWVCASKRADYIGVDKAMTTETGRVEKMVDVAASRMKKIYANWPKPPYAFYHGDVRQLPNDLPVCEISHMRFVLMHLSPPDRVLALRSLRGKTGKLMILCEWDYSSFSAEGKYKGHIDEFRDLSIEFIILLKSDAFAGMRLPALIAESFGQRVVTYERFHQETGNYLKQLLALGQMFKDLAEQRGMGDFANRFHWQVNRFEYMIKNNFELPFTPPAICTAMVRF